MVSRPGGAGPSSPLIADSAGSLTGAAAGGGNGNCQGGCGVIFRITP
ncbi:MAG TPA: hypothetical protein VGX91_13770 [Candidatus Cybelea sp.]|jgi:hypothetical protein|nr:hypothetical protein [Candidatus Cybelea sp.]